MGKSKKRKSTKIKPVDYKKFILDLDADGKGSTLAAMRNCNEALAYRTVQVAALEELVKCYERKLKKAKRNKKG